eukprot:3645895-Rhodomonas_salina.3
MQRMIRGGCGWRGWLERNDNAEDERSGRGYLEVRMRLKEVPGLSSRILAVWSARLVTQHREMPIRNKTSRGGIK